MTTAPIEGVHHVTSVAGDPSRNYRFYTDVLGLRLVKRTVNFDDVTTYHLYYGNKRGDPGTALTFFPFEHSGQGTVGAGQVRTTQFHVPSGSLDYWADRFEERDVTYDGPRDRFDERVLPFRGPDGLAYELVATVRDAGIEPWTAVVPDERAIRGFNGVALAVGDPGPTADLLETMGYERIGGDGGDRIRYRSGDETAAVVDLVPTDEQGRPGVGTVHHVAFRVADEEEQVAWQAALREQGYQVTEQKDRRYFRSIYFRERNDVLFELATTGPGFDRDEPVADLGTSLQLPPWLEDDRERIASRLPPLEFDAEVQP